MKREKKSIQTAYIYWVFLGLAAGMAATLATVEFGDTLELDAVLALPEAGA